MVGYEEYMQVGIRVDSLKNEVRRWETLLSNLDENGVHKETCIVYSVNAVKDRILDLEIEIEKLERIMDE